MTTFSPLAKSVGISPKRGSREGSRIDTILWHHMASRDGQGVTNMMLSPGGRVVSANYTILNDGTILGVVPEEDRAWTSGAAGDGGRGAAWDRRSITVEIENETVGPRNEDYTISEAAIEAAARLSVDLRTRHPIVQEYGHRDLYQKFGASYATYCPGPDTVERIAAARGELDPSNNPIQEDDMTPEQSQMLKEIHDALFKDGKEQKDWSALHKIDHTNRMVSTPVVDAPGGPQKKWTMPHALNWLMRQVNEILDRLPAKK